MKLVNQVEPTAALKYNKHYIGLEVNRAPMNFVSFMPRKAHLLMMIKLPKAKEIDDQLAAPPSKRLRTKLNGASTGSESNQISRVSNAMFSSPWRSRRVRVTVRRHSRPIHPRASATSSSRPESCSFTRCR